MNNLIDLLHYASIGLKQGHYAAYSTTIVALCPITSFNLSNIIVNPLISNALGPTYYYLETVDVLCTLAKDCWDKSPSMCELN